VAQTLTSGCTFPLAKVWAAFSAIVCIFTFTYFACKKEQGYFPGALNADLHHAITGKPLKKVLPYPRKRVGMCGSEEYDRPVGRRITVLLKYQLGVNGYIMAIGVLIARK
jgi:hypothetical protein